MPGRKGLSKIQWGKEATPGTGVAATAIYRGNGGMIEDQTTVLDVNELVGILGDTDRAVITKRLAIINLADAPLSYEQAAYFFAMGIGGPVTGTSDGAGTDKIYTTNIPTTAAPANTFYTVETGDDFEQERATYVHCTKLDISGKMGGIVMAKGTLQGQASTLIASFTPSLSIPAVEDIPVNKGKVYLSPVGTVEASQTQVANQILDFNLAFEFLWIPKWTMDGNLFFSFPQYVGHKLTGTITFEHDTAVSGSGGEKANYRAKTQRQLGIRFLGSALATAGTAYSTKAFKINTPITWTKMSTVDEVNGNSIVTGSFFSKYNLTAGNAGIITVVPDALTALP